MDAYTKFSKRNKKRRHLEQTRIIQEKKVEESNRPLQSGDRVKITGNPEKGGRGEYKGWSGYILLIRDEDDFAWVQLDAGQLPRYKIPKAQLLRLTQDYFPVYY